MSWITSQNNFHGNPFSLLSRKDCQHVLFVHYLKCNLLHVTTCIISPIPSANNKKNPMPSGSHVKSMQEKKCKNYAKPSYKPLTVDNMFIK